MKKFLVLAAILTMLIAGCTPGGEPTGSPFVGGNNGLLVRFLENAPPEEVTDSNTFPFQIVVILENAGETDIAANMATVSVIGVHPSDFNNEGTTPITSAQLTETVTTAITGAQKGLEGSRIEGSMAQVELPNSGAGGSDGQMQYNKASQGITLPLMADVCYVYGTEASGSYCLKSDVISTRDEGVCDVSGAKPIYSSGSPVQVSSLTQSVAGSDHVLLTFRIAHRGNGQIFRTETSYATNPPNCGKGLEGAGGTVIDADSISDEDTVYVEIDAGVAVADIECFGLTGGANNNGFVRLDNQGNAVVSCKIAGGGVDAVREVTADLTFEYLETRRRNIRINHLPD